MESSSTENVPSTNRKKLHHHSSPHTQGAALVQYENEYEKLNASHLLTWRTLMEEGNYKSSSFYKRVKVLLISWDEDCDDLNVKGEVEKLSKVFSETFRYQVTPALLKKDPEHAAHLQVVRHVSDFLWKEDRTNTLLIVYYAGHGTLGQPGILKLSGKSAPSDSIEDLNEIAWNHVDSMFQQIKADVLEIFDCCYAGDLGRHQQAWGTRCFEFLGATSSQGVTRSPGPESFTTALIWALETLVKEQGRFTISGLTLKIREAPRFPADQVPVYFDRGMHAIERIVLAPLSSDCDSGEQATPTSLTDFRESAPQGLLNLNFLFEKPPTQQEITKLARSLNRVMYKDQMPVTRIVWGGLCAWGGTHPSPSAGFNVIHAANQFKAGLSRSRSKSNTAKANPSASAGLQTPSTDQERSSPRLKSHNTSPARKRPKRH